ncbi:hypothetical protein DLF87_14555 [Escherichia coli O157]|nr:hypothetical protein [Escherichia coli O157]
MAISSYSTVTDKFANLTKIPDEIMDCKKNQKNFVCLLVMRRSIQ